MKCNSCGHDYDDNAFDCPNCGAPNPKKYTGKGKPKTIQELQKWYEYHNLPPENITRFFIGQDYKKPKAYGIYFDGKDYIVYKNKADGSRAIRYQGPDEAYAVNEILTKLKEEIARRKKPSSTSRQLKPKKKNDYIGTISLCITFGTIIFIVGVAILSVLYSHRHDGYYKVNDVIYYNYEDEWYTWDDWYYDYVSVDPPFEGNYWDYYEYDTSDYSSDYYHDFYSSNLYDEISSSSSSDGDWSSDDYSWDSSDSWDSGGDWDSDW